MDQQEKYWGVHTSIDLKNCNLDLIKSKEKIADFVIGLCRLIEMQRFGDVIIYYFGNDEKVAGYSFAQFIETSLISGHFCDKDRSAYIDIFSCKDYKHFSANVYTRDFFEAKESKFKVTYRE